MKVVIVSRHKATIEALKKLNPQAEVISGNATEEDIRGNIIFGNIPLHLACLAEEVRAVEFKKFPPRGDEFEGDLWKDYGMSISKYKVYKI